MKIIDNKPIPETAEEAVDLDQLVNPPNSQTWWTFDQVAKHLQTTRRTITRWVADGQLPPPRKFGRLARFPRDLIELIGREGVAAANPTFERLNHLPPEGLPLDCPHCSAKLNLTRGNVVELVKKPRASAASKSGTIKVDKPTATKAKKKE